MSKNLIWAFYIGLIASGFFYAVYWAAIAAGKMAGG